MLLLKKYAPRAVCNGLLFGLCAVMLLPFCWMVSTSLRLPRDSFNLPPDFFPSTFHYQNYRELFTKFPFWTFIFNSLKVSSAVVVLNILVTTLAAFAFSRIRFRGRDLLFLVFLGGMMIPQQATLIPVYIIMSQLKLVGTLWALILPATISPLSIFLVRQHMLTIPRSYDEAAYMDGAGRLRIFFRIILPMSKPVIIMTGLLSFLASWNNFMGPLIYLTKWESMTLPVGIRTLSGFMSTGSISIILAGVVVSLVVPTLLYVIGQKYIVQGMALSGLKS